MAYSQNDLDALKAELLSLERRMQDGDRSVEHWQADEIQRRIQLVEQDMALTSGRRPVRQIRAFSNKGI